MTPTQRHIAVLGGFWVWAVVMTWMDHQVGPDANTFHLIGVAAAVTIAYAGRKAGKWRNAPRKEGSA